MWRDDRPGGGLTPRDRTRPSGYDAVTMRLRVAIFMTLAACAAGAQTPKLDKMERAIARAVDERSDDAVALLQRVVDINSGTLNLDGVRAVGVVFREELDDLGFSTRWEDGGSFGRAGHLIGERGPANRKPHLLLIGHLDTVFEVSSPFQRFERVDRDTAKGPGVIDMKGGDVVMLEALRALHAAQALDGIRITVYLSGDEERAGRPLVESRRSLMAAAEAADIALGFENAANDPRTAVIARRGSMTWKLTATGKTAHSSQIFKDGVGFGAVFEAARVLDGFRRLAGERYLSFSPGLLLGGTTVELIEAEARGNAFGKNNVIAETAFASGDLRTISPEQLETVKTAMREVVAEGLPETSSRLEFDEGYPPMPPTSGNESLLRTYDEVSRDLGLGPVTAVDPGSAGAADIAFTAGRVDMAIDGLGLLGGGDHTIGETADLRLLPSQTKRAALLMLRLSRGADTK